MLEISLWITLVMMSLSVLGCFIRVISAPAMADRVVALDTIAIYLIGIVGLILILQETIAYVEVALVVSILSFIGTIGFAKFLEKGVIIDRNN